MVLVKIFRSDDLEGLETQMQTALENLPPTFNWAGHDVIIQYDSKSAMSRMSYSALVFIKPNS